MKKKIFALVLVLLATFGMFAFVNTDTLGADTKYPASLNISATRKQLPNYLNGFDYNGIRTVDGKVVYCLDKPKLAPIGTVSFYGELDAGFAHIIKNGYPNKSITGDNQKDEAITQLVLWKYIDGTRGTNNLTSSYYNASDPQGLKPQVDKLYNAALAAKKAGYPTVTMSASVGNSELKIDSTNKYFVSSPITVSSTSLTTNYTVSLTKAVSGVQFTDVNGNVKTSFKPSEKFLVRIPADKITDMVMNFEVNINAKGEVVKAYEYRSSSDKDQPIVTTALYPTTKAVSAKVNLSLRTSRVKIAKLDVKTNNFLPGATLVITNGANQVLKTWVSINGYLVLNNLPDGRYYIKETKAPTGYKLNDEVVSFSVNDDKTRDQIVKFYNEPKQSVVTITKVDSETNKILPGATLVIKDGAGKVVKQFVTTDKPTVITDLSDGVYSLSELKAPEGYVVSKDVFEFLISDKSNSHQITFKNKAKVVPPPPEKPDPEVPVPPTDANANVITTIVGTLLIASGLGYMQNDKKRKYSL